MNIADQMEKFELVTADAEYTYAKGMIKELHDKLVDTIPLMTKDDLNAFIALVECELNERDENFDDYLTDLPF
jgi:hypothetical protein